MVSTAPKPANDNVKKDNIPGIQKREPVSSPPENSDGEGVIDAKPDVRAIKIIVSNMPIRKNAIP